MPKKVIDALSNSPAGPYWKKIGIKHHHGFVVPLFSLHSRFSCGIGEFTDLISLIHWTKDVGCDTIQLLPLNDTALERSPYSAISAFALHPIYLGLAKLPFLNQHPDLQLMLNDMHALCHQQKIPYEAVVAVKQRFLTEYIRRIAEKMSVSPEFQSFKKKHQYWLESYSLFKAIKNANHWHSWETWPEELKNITPEKYKEISSHYSDEIQYHSLVQYFCYQQMEAAKKEADKMNVLLMGDIPILINRDSADVWTKRHLFHLEYSSGSPPDMFAEDGQNWGFPVYNWAEIEKDDFTWWKERLAASNSLYHLYRIDHVVGFFRIWTIPTGHRGREGYFIPQNEREWIPQGKKIMEMMLKSSSMLPIGEDLGTVPPEVRTCLSQLGICGTKVMRWERAWNTDRHFIDIKEYPAESLTTVSTHDTETLQQWWENNSQEAREFAQSRNWEMSYSFTTNRRQEILRESHHSSSLFHINLLQEYLYLIPGMTWPNLEDERINVPGVVSDRNWTYRFRPSLEVITTSIPLRQAIEKLVS